MLCGNVYPHTIKIQGKLKGVPITILVDSGSTHSFIDHTVIKQCGEVRYQTKQISITVADGNKLTSDAICPKLKWTMQGLTFKFEF